MDAADLGTITAGSVLNSTVLGTVLLLSSWSARRHTPRASPSPSTPNVPIANAPLLGASPDFHAGHRNTSLPEARWAFDDLPGVSACPTAAVGNVSVMSCIRFNTPAQRQSMRDHRPVMLTSEQAAGLHPAPPVTESKIRRLRLLAANANPKIRESAAGSFNAPEDLFRALAKDCDEGVRACVARNEATPCDVLRSLADDPSERVRGFLAINFSAPADVMARLADDSSETVRGLVSWKGALADA